MGLATLLFTAIVLSIIVFSAEVFERETSESITSSYMTEEARRISSFTFDILYSSMREGWNKDDIRAGMSKINKSNPGINVRLIRGPVVKNQYGNGLEDSSASDKLISNALKGTEGSELRNGRFRFAYPIFAKEECLSCHTKSYVGAVHGVIEITKSAAELSNAMQNASSKTSFAFLVGVVSLV